MVTIDIYVVWLWKYNVFVNLLAPIKFVIILVFAQRVLPYVWYIFCIRQINLMKHKQFILEGVYFYKPVKYT